MILQRKSANFFRLHLYNRVSLLKLQPQLLALTPIAKTGSATLFTRSHLGIVLI